MVLYLLFLHLHHPVANGQVGDPCPKGPDQWKLLVNTELQYTIGLRPSPNQLLMDIFGAPDDRGYSETQIRKCLGSADTNSNKCLNQFLNLRKFRTNTDGQSRSASYLKNRNVEPDYPVEKYYQENKHLLDLKNLPSELTDPMLLNMLNNPNRIREGIQRIKEIGAKKGLKVYEYEGQFGSLLRTVVFIPGKEADYWIQYTLTNPNSVSQLPPGFPKDLFFQGAAFIVVEKQQGDKTLENPRLHYVSPSVTKNGPHISGLKINMETDSRIRSLNPTDCRECHQGGLIGIHPNPKFNYFTKNDTTTLHDLSEYIGDYGPTVDAVNSARKVDDSMEEFGPSIGAVNPPTRTTNFMQTCATRTKPDRIRIVQKAMNCTKCHDNTTRNFAYIGTQERMSILHQAVVVSKKMPPDSDLSESERTDLEACLLQEYRSSWQGWLNKRGCVISTDELSGNTKPTLPQGTVAK